MANPIDLCIGSNLKLIRLSLGYNIEQAAEIAKITPKMWQEWEAGETRLDANDIWKLKQYFNVNPSDLYVGLMSIRDER